MAVNTSGVINVYEQLSGAIKTQIDGMYTRNEIDAETYAKLLSQTFSNMMELSVKTVQSQESLDKDNLIKDQQLDSMLTEDYLKREKFADDILTSNKQRDAMDVEMDVNERSMFVKEEQLKVSKTPTLLGT